MPFRKPTSFSLLGPLEQAVVEALWSRGESSVQEIGESLGRPLAYTTVMTTLDRLFKKGLLERRRVERAFYYRAAHTRQEMQQREFVDRFLNWKGDGELLLSSLVDAVGQYDAALLDELEEQIRRKRQELEAAKRKRGPQK